MMGPQYIYIYIYRLIQSHSSEECCIHHGVLAKFGSMLVKTRDVGSDHRRTPRHIWLLAV